MLTCGSPLHVRSKHWEHSSMETGKCLYNRIFHGLTWQQEARVHISLFFLCLTSTSFYEDLLLFFSPPFQQTHTRMSKRYSTPATQLQGWLADWWKYSFACVSWFMDGWGKESGWTTCSEMQGATFRLKRHELEIIGCGINSCAARGSMGVCVRERERGREKGKCVASSWMKVRMEKWKRGKVCEEACGDFCWCLSAGILQTQDENTSSYWWQCEHMLTSSFVK